MSNDMIITIKLRNFAISFAGASGTAGAVFAEILPTGMRPSSNELLRMSGTSSSGSGIYCIVKIQPDGKMCFTSNISGIYGNGAFLYQVP